MSPYPDDPGDEMEARGFHAMEEQAQADFGAAWPEGRPMAEAPKDGVILVVDNFGEFRIVSWKAENYFDEPLGWVDDEYRRVSPVKWWPLPKAEGVAR